MVVSRVSPWIDVVIKTCPNIVICHKNKTEQQYVKLLCNSGLCMSPKC